MIVCFKGHVGLNVAPTLLTSKARDLGVVKLFMWWYIKLITKQKRPRENHSNESFFLFYSFQIKKGFQGGQTFFFP